MIASRALLKETPMRFKNNQSKLYVLESIKQENLHLDLLHLRFDCITNSHYV